MAFAFGRMDRLRSDGSENGFVLGQVEVAVAVAAEVGVIAQSQGYDGAARDGDMAFGTDTMADERDAFLAASHHAVIVSENWRGNGLPERGDLVLRVGLFGRGLELELLESEEVLH